MARCNSCSAPLPANINKCNYCGIRNDVDLTGKHDFHVHTGSSGRICPHCEIDLETIRLNLTDTLYIERCKKCYGLFFDSNEIEQLLDYSVKNVFDVNLEHLININKDRYRLDQTVKYVKCPVCQNFMRRVNYGHKSGVVMDQCKTHGIWLDNGEITHLMEWKKAGGQILHEKKNATKKKVSKIKDFSGSDNYLSGQIHEEQDLISGLSTFINKVFNL